MTAGTLLLLTLGMIFVVIMGGYFLYALYKIMQIKDPIKMPTQEK